MKKTDIEWTNSTWNPVTGCTKISAGCRNCYAERMSRRLRAMGQKRYQNGFKVTLHPDQIELPLYWNKSQMIFVNSMSDLFHKDVPLSFIRDLFDVMKKASHHTFQILTKRAKRLALLAPMLEWPSNIWMGVTVESQEYLWRVDCLSSIPASVRFVSLEPLIGRIIGIAQKDIDWIIVGGESGPGSREIQPDWVREIRDECIDADIPFFFKQWGGVQKKRNGRILDGEIWEQYPNCCQPHAGIL